MSNEPYRIELDIEDATEYYGRWVTICIGGERERIVLIDIKDDENLETPEVAMIVSAIKEAFAPGSEVQEGFSPQHMDMRSVQDLSP